MENANANANQNQAPQAAQTAPNSSQTQRVVLGTCPKCNGQVVAGKYGPYCASKCGMTLNKAYGKDLSNEQVQALLAGQSITLLGIVSKRTGKAFDAILTPGEIEEFSCTGQNGQVTKYRYKFTMSFPDGNGQQTAAPAPAPQPVPQSAPVQYAQPAPAPAPAPAPVQPAPVQYAQPAQPVAQQSYVQPAPAPVQYAQPVQAAVPAPAPAQSAPMFDIPDLPDDELPFA